MPRCQILFTLAACRLGLAPE